MRFPRQCGVLLHPSSLPGRHGIGDLGPQITEFLDFLADARQSLWHVLPLGPTGSYASPFTAYSAFAGNPLFISLDRLAEESRLDRFALDDASFGEGRVSYEACLAFKIPLLDRAAGLFQRDASPFERSAFDAFCRSEAHWLDDFALFTAARRRFELAHWPAWPEPLRDRHPDALARLAEEEAATLHAVKYRQWIFSRQWQTVRDACQARAIRIIGDLPLFVTADSADVWCNRELWDLDPQGIPNHVVAAPPSFHHPTGRVFSTPVYRWDACERTAFRWWSRRFRSAFNFFDVVRINSFHGVHATWQTPVGASSAIAGNWLPGPGARLFEVLEQRLGPLPVIADTSTTSSELESILHRFGYPATTCLLDAFSRDPQSAAARPHNYSRQSVAYLGTQDTETAAAWWSRVSANPDTTLHTLAYLGLDPAKPEAASPHIHTHLIRTLLASVANTAIIPAQDLLGLGVEASMNPATQRSGRWSWRLRPGQLTPPLAARYAALAALYDRVPAL